MTLHTYLASMGISDARFAELVGRHRVTVSRWRRGKVVPDWEALSAISKATGGQVTANDFLIERTRCAQPFQEAR